MGCPLPFLTACQARSDAVDKYWAEREAEQEAAEQGAGEGEEDEQKEEYKS